MTDETRLKQAGRNFKIQAVRKKSGKWQTIFAALALVLALAFVVTVAAAILWLNRVLAFISVLELVLAFLCVLMGLSVALGEKDLIKDIQDGKHDDTQF